MLNAADTQTRPFGERLLGRTGRDPVLPHQCTERDRFFGVHPQPTACNLSAHRDGTTPSVSPPRHPRTRNGGLCGGLGVVCPTNTVETGRAEEANTRRGSCS